MPALTGEKQTERKDPVNRRNNKLLRAVLAAALLAAMLTGCGNAQTGPSNETQGGTEPPAQSQPEPSTPLVTAPEDEPYIEQPTQPPVQVVMPEYELSYSGNMADVISWQELPEEGGLQFYVKLSTGDAALFTLLLDRMEGELVTMKENSAGEKVPVSFLMEEIPEDLSEEDKTAFCFAQDTVNEIIASLKLK